MLSLQQIEQDLTAAMKAKDQTAVDVLRGLKTRIQNERIARSAPLRATVSSIEPVAKMSPLGGSPAGGKELSEDILHNLVRSEIKKRKEAAASFVAGGRGELADKELKEAEILEKYLPAQMAETDLLKLIDASIAENSFTSKDFGKAMGALKAKVGNTADGAVLAKLLKEKLK